MYAAKKAKKVSYAYFDALSRPGVQSWYIKKYCSQVQRLIKVEIIRSLYQVVTHNRYNSHCIINTSTIYGQKQIVIFSPKTPLPQM